MTKIQSNIVAILQKELEYTDADSQYSQWVLGVSIKDEAKSQITARVVVKTNESPYVDGMDIAFTETESGVAIDPVYFENAPDFHG